MKTHAAAARIVAKTRTEGMAPTQNFPTRFSEPLDGDKTIAQFLSKVNGSLVVDFKKETTMYAIAFDLDDETVQKTYHNSSYTNAWGDIRKFLEARHFQWQQRSVYFGDPAKINAITCVVTVIEMTRALPWFAASVRDIRMLRIEEFNDLRPAIDAAIIPA